MVYFLLCLGIFEISTLVGSHDPFILMPVSRSIIRKQLLGLNPRKAVGLDKIPSFFLHDGPNSIVEPVCHLINTSIFTEMVPSGFKQARVRPLFKKGSKLDAFYLSYQKFLRGLFMISFCTICRNKACCTSINRALEGPFQPIHVLLACLILLKPS